MARAESLPAYQAHWLSLLVFRLRRSLASSLAAGAAIFWSIVLAAIVVTVRTGSLPFKDSSAVAAKEFYESIAAKPRWWLAVNITFSIGIIVTAMGLTLLGGLMREAGDVGFADLGLVAFLMAATLCGWYRWSSTFQWRRGPRKRRGALEPSPSPLGSPEPLRCC